MWRVRAKEVLAILILVVVAGIFWLRTESPGQKPVRVSASIVSFATPAVSDAVLAQKDLDFDVTVRFADGRTMVLAVPISLTRNCRVGQTVVLLETVNRAGLRNWSIPPDGCG